MSLSTIVKGINEMSVSNSTSSVSDSCLGKFPCQREKEEFPDWLFKVQAFLDAKGLYGVVTDAVPGLQRYNDVEIDKNDEDFVEYDFDSETGEEKKSRLDLTSKSKKAYNYIIQSLNKKQIELIRSVYQGNAHVVMNVLNKTYGIKKSTAATMSLYAKLNTNTKLSIK